MEQIFTAYAKFGQPKSDGKQITLANLTKWLKQAGIIDGKKITSTDVDIAFSKLKAKQIDCKTFEQLMKNLASEKNLNYEDLASKLMKCNIPGTSGAATSAKSAIVDRLTDTSKYTGSHKERFDKEGKGKGIAGRADTQENSGYVQGYKHKDTYEDKA